MFGGACNGAAGPGNVEICGRGAVALRGVVRGESRQVYSRAELGFLEGTPLCPCLIQNYREAVPMEATNRTVILAEMSEGC